ncbi:hypothetical protein CEE44_03965 [Candidatus Woesearchaeota archaeon B3_Woes]|nr:MAG: hypothetical protein CEE44_03965 [Candidatus Woesearchaeota archaeon B3_Woes]
MGEETSRKNYNKLISIVISGITNDNKILLIKRVTPPYVGFWSMPGGKIEFGEHPEQTALREIKEETDLDCEFEGFRGIASEIIHNKDDKVAHLMIYVCKLKPLHTNIQATKEGELQWFDINELKNTKIIPSDLSMIKEFLLKDSKVDLHKIKMTEEEGEYRLEEFGK